MLEGLRETPGSLDRGLTLPQINMEADKGPYIEDSSLIKGPSPLPC